MHFLTSFPKFQSILFEDPTMRQIKEEINISKLDLLVIIELLKFTSLFESESVIKHLKCLGNIEESRVLLGLENTNLFWENLNIDKAGAISDHQMIWNNLWKDTKSSLIKILRFLKDREVLKESGFSKQIEEIRLFETWTKQEIIQNWNGAIEKQIKSLGFFRNKRTLTLKNSEEVLVSVFVCDDHRNGIKDSEDVKHSGLLSSVFSYLGSFFWNKQESEVEQLSLQDISLDSHFAALLDSKMKKLVKMLLSDQAFVDVSIVEVAKGKNLMRSNF